jgi:hypothetical protein
MRKMVWNDEGNIGKSAKEERGRCRPEISADAVKA